MDKCEINRINADDPEAVCPGNLMINPSGLLDKIRNFKRGFGWHRCQVPSILQDAEDSPAKGLEDWEQPRPNTLLYLSRDCRHCRNRINVAIETYGQTLTGKKLLDFSGIEPPDKQLASFVDADRATPL